MKTLAAFALLVALVAAPAKAQKLNLNLNFDAIAKNAAEKTELSLEGPMLGMLKQKQPLFASVDQVSVHSYEFAKSGDYTDSDLDPLRRQVANTAGWTRVLNVKEKDEDTQIYVFMQGGKPAGFLLIAAEAKELTVVQIAGSIPLAQLQELVDSTIHFQKVAQD